MATSGVFGKLQLKDQDAIVILNAPSSFEKELRGLNGVQIHREFAGPTRFALAFMTTWPELERYANGLRRHAEGDAVVWAAYPKGSSKRYTTELGRDAGWQPLGDLGYEPVSMIAIDEDWTAKRFRRAETSRASPAAVSTRCRSWARPRRENGAGEETCLPNQSMKPTAQLRCNFSVFATTRLLRQLHAYARARH